MKQKFRHSWFCRQVVLSTAVILLPVAVAVPVRAQEEAGKWAFTPAVDTFSKEAMFDLRSLNEKTAGESGFVTRTKDGNDFALGNGTPIRFWAVTDYTQNLPGMKDLEHHARWLAKRGVNMVRFHGQLAPTGPDAKITDVNHEEIDHCWKLVAAMKKEGIYTTISPYWAGSIPNDKIPASWGVEGATGEQAWGLLFWDKTMQAGYKAWARALFAPPNPYTGIPLAKDPAVALIQLQNEDSMLFWTMQNIKGAQLAKVERYFGDWLMKKYGSLDKAKAAWDGVGREDDDFAHGRVGLYIVWEWTQPQSGGKAARLRDQLQFFAEAMVKFDKEMTAFYRDELGCKQLINAGNWKTADTVKLNDVERWTYTADDVIAVNRYFDGIHIGPRSGWAMDPGDRFTNVSALLDPRSLPLDYKQVVGHPNIISESSWVPPTLYQSEGPFLVAAYSSLTGVDTFYWFCIGDVPEWQPPIGKWSIGTPEQLGQFPAAALMYRLGYIRKGEAAVHEERPLEDLWERKTPIIAEDKSFDPNRDTGSGGAKSNVQHGVDPLAFLVGPVEVKYGGDPAKTSVIDLAHYIDHADKTVRSDTGQIKLNYGIGLCTLDAPKAQGATGFLNKAGEIKLSDLDIKSDNDYATVMVVAMDGRPLRDSRKILVQIGTVARPTGWQDKAATFKTEDGKETVAGRQIVSVGTSPWQLADDAMTLTLRNPNLKTATLLDANGNAVRSVAHTGGGNGFSVKLPPDTMYMVLE